MWVLSTRQPLLSYLHLGARSAPGLIIFVNPPSFFSAWLSLCNILTPFFCERVLLWSGQVTSPAVFNFSFQPYRESRYRGQIKKYNNNNNRGKSLAWDVTVVNTLADSYISAAPLSQVSVAEMAAERKILKYFAWKHHLSTSCLWDVGSDQSIWSRFYFWKWSQIRASLRWCTGTLPSFPTPFLHCPAIQLCGV